VGGGTWTTYNLTRELSERGNKVDLIIPNVDFIMTIKRSDAEAIQNKNTTHTSRVPSFKIPNYLGPLLSIVPMLLEGTKFRGKIDVIVCQYHPMHFVSLVALILGKLLRIPVVARADDIYREMWDKPSIKIQLTKMTNVINESLIKNMAAFLVVSPTTRGLLINRMGKRCIPEKIGVSPNGYNAIDFKVTSSPSKTRSTLGLRVEDKVVLFVGRFSGNEYGIKYLLEAFRLVLYEEPHAILILLGDEPSKSILNLVKYLGIETHTRIYGPCPHSLVIRFISVSDVCIGPLLATDTMPLKIVEYLAGGKPVITGKGSITPEFKPVTGLIEVAASPVNISKAILNVLKDSKNIQEITTNGPEQVKAFTWEQISADLEYLLYKVIVKEVEK